MPKAAAGGVPNIGFVVTPPTRRRTPRPHLLYPPPFSPPVLFPPAPAAPALYPPRPHRSSPRLPHSPLFATFPVVSQPGGPPSPPATLAEDTAVPWGCNRKGFSAYG